MFPLVICWFWWAHPPTRHFIKVTLPTPNSHVRCGYTLNRTLTRLLGLAEFKIYSYTVFVAILLLQLKPFMNHQLLTGAVLLTADKWGPMMKLELNKDNDWTCYFNISSFCVMCHGNALLQGFRGPADRRQMRLHPCCQIEKQSRNELTFPESIAVMTHTQWALFSYWTG